VVLLGERRDLPCVYNGFDFLVSSSLVEAFPNVLGEAMSCGVPCIATAVGDSAWIVGDTGVSVPPDDPAVLGEAMAAAASWPVVERKRRGSAARARVVENFAIAAVTEEFLRAYEDVRRGRRDERCT
ncbi:MAG: glycosyltransferase, partial [Spirochaetaceae bacterium]